ncbi:MAG TPA: transcription-repair coupling factor [Candidatus Kapabacteria bacterium]|nr:transcription-repair coupling factor [Candidatus Kapabacteria bacterium]
MRQILDRISTSNTFASLLDALKQRREIPVRSIAGSLRSTIIALLYQRTAEPFLMIFEDRADADAVYADLVTLIGSEHTLLYQEEHHTAATLRDTLDAELVSLSDALKVLSDDPLRIIVTDIETLSAPVPSARNIAQNIMELRVGERVGLEDLARRLALGGFERADIVESVGQYALRGGIIDIFPAGVDNPIRVEFFGDELESIREFDPGSQRSVRDLPRVELMARLFHAEDDELAATVLDHIREETVLYLEEPERLFGLLEDAGRESLIEAIGKFRHISHSLLYSASDAEVIDVGARAQPSFSSSLAELCRAVGGFRLEGYSVFLLSDGDEARRRAEQLVEGECDRAEESGEPYPFATTELSYETETLTNGFILPNERIAVITEHEVFNRKRARARVVRRKQFKGFTMRELKQLRQGDFVVHVDKGIGRFIGLETISVGGSRVEAVKLEYAAGDTLFVNLNYINRLQKYSSKEGSQPKLSRLGTEEWERIKARAKRRVKDIARELIRLYALRKSQPGFEFPPDSTWQRELEASFMYEDTPDQASATWAVKRDMESPTPMDRLVCGDVGFGKTEVAIRAAFKAVQGGKQVAVLAPTTILAQQHYNSFRDRLARYAVNVALLSRFRSKMQQKETLEGLKAGTVDVLIGTHRLLSKDVRFKDLGLLIIDEEQRFGVAAKEKLRQIRANVDTLTLTATPIPRTLNFSLMGARDLSLIETPPRNRLPIVTELMQWNDEALVDAIRRELKRGGQCFLVHWRIGDIEDLAGSIATLVPEARVAVIHGAMTADQIEKTMMGFIERNADVLVATKIIESGIDIPSVNTIIVNRADKFGLAELYQLRGRVGRSNIQAYCYMVVPPPQTLSRIAMKRLQAIQELTDLGSGLKLAMRDLEIRGAGNLLGSEQSGFIEDVGFELYQKIVDEAVEELKRDEFRDLFREQLEEEERELRMPVNEDLVVEIDGDALIPKSYIADDAERYEFYQRMYAANDPDRLRTIASEMRDRFGEIPEPTERLVDAIRLRLAAMPSGAAKLTLRGGTLRLELPSDSNREYYDRWFHPMMASINRQRFCQLETRGRALAIVFSKVDDVDEAVRTLEGFTATMRASAREMVAEREEMEGGAG